ncbi:glutamine--fructose-6-phosphate transaminase (isomerizing) [Sulfuracidifex metallicus]|uniref:Glutamine--fructose-6-phosphate aminotransferase [isomerizing] n=1 Tax=Sulfuracidifex metallicus DSM 6482 = JCM 9184 TaxID=523847 RepID=A0A6A9QGX8_SULME|nr:glutamine--fructose-6-phosphate transaminase (isomerizing) [Sulfuracidifex metallicus]MUN28276.1 glutamine--fructose-6-phosphate transaminase (isomerizing) [Sulfuracidifex metallicus DSM 6482 = JCM 9184]WOE51193.1 glutamine--fructose-6-phosphate transaminase (isomerizing) [Sulfuracidifex metallicus DSM 6482 = JCM 9184]
MCGIIGIASSKKDRTLTDVLVSSLARLEYRGYDSVGVASLDEGGIDVRKAKGKVVEVVKRKKINEMNGYLFLGHTRWATHGAPNDQNAHPHIDCTGKIAVVHNGTLTNYKELREELESLGHKFRSDTDTEVIPHLVEEFMKRGMDSFSAFKAAISSLKGSYAILMIMEGERRIFFARLDNPLVIGLGEDNKNFVASEYAPFLPFTSTVVTIQDGEVGFVTPSSVYIEKDGKVVDINDRIHKLNFSVISASKGGYSHFMLKEIHESPLAVKETISTMLSDEAVVEASRIISNANRVFVVAAGTSYHAGLFFTRYLNLSSLTAIPVIASEYSSYKAKSGDVVLALSQSGETLDVKMAIKKFRNDGASIISITNVIESTISRESDVKLYMRAGPELGVAATKTFVSQVASLMILKSRVLNEDTSYLAKAPQILEDAVEETEGKMKRWSTLIDFPSVYYLSKGIGVPLAMEGALKIKEVAYVHAEAYPAGESKHGPIALVSEGFPVIFVNPGLDELKVNMEEMKSRGAKIFSISTVNTNLTDNEVIVKSERDLEPFALSPPLQLLAFYVSVNKGIDPDRPRNLAKTVTVE